MTASPGTGRTADHPPNERSLPLNCSHAIALATHVVRDHTGIAPVTQDTSAWFDTALLSVAKAAR
jgi:hypothetical protein